MMFCKKCNVEIIGRRADALYCSKRCADARWAKENREKASRWNKANPEKEMERMTRWRKANPDKVRARRASWAKRNPEKVAINSARQINRRRNLPHDLTLDQWQAALAYFDNSCAYCGTKLTKAHKEHFLPAAKSGGYTKSNIVPSCPKCNLRKSNKNPLDWMVMQVHGLVAYVRVKQYLELT